MSGSACYDINRDLDAGFPVLRLLSIEVKCAGCRSFQRYLGFVRGTEDIYVVQRVQVADG